ncbi:MAG: PHP domain-containing protein [Ruminococcaceae bacterium]|nr:PHP domain-containing protein [Oscillospiraceae bacterium]
MKRSIFIDEGKFYKGNLHTHSTMSDGFYTPHQVKEEYKKLGYDFVAFTDHGVFGIHEDLWDDEFITIPGVEVGPADDPNNTFWQTNHVVALGLPGKCKYTQGEKIFHFGDPKYEHDVNKVCAELRENGCFCIYGHPYWSHIDPQALIGLEGFVGVEVFNGGSELNGNGYSELYIENMLWHGIHTHLYATDDMHFGGEWDDLGKGFVCVKAKSLSYEDIVDSLLKGSFYASTGAEIYDFYSEDETVYLKCAPCREIRIMDDAFNGRKYVYNKNNPNKSVALEYDENGYIIGASFAYRANSHYVYAKITDVNGKEAWTQPLWRE